MDEVYVTLTMRISEIEKVIGSDNMIIDERGSLTSWYSSIRNKHIESLEVKDYAIMMRQNLYVKNILPIVLRILTDKPFLGAQFNGELLLTIKHIDKQFWNNNRQLLLETCELVDLIMSSNKFQEFEFWFYEDESEELKMSITNLKNKLESI